MRQPYALDRACGISPPPLGSEKITAGLFAGRQQVCVLAAGVPTSCVCLAVLKCLPHTD